MFDDRLFDVIMGEMMNTFGADVRTDEGSLAYNACAAIALKLEEVYGDMSDLNDNMFIDTMDLAHLIDIAERRGITYRTATAPIVKGVFHQSINEGDRFSCNDFVYTVIELIDGFAYKMVCATSGTEANANFGELTPIDFVDDWQGGTITDVLVAGTNDQTEEELKHLIKASYKSLAFGGNKADYRLFTNMIEGVGGSKAKRREADSPYVNIYIISATNGVPSNEIVNAAQTAIDPLENAGEGEGYAPICHKVKVYPVEGVNINVTATVVFDSGYSVETSQELINNAVKDYLTGLCESWESLNFVDMVVRIAQIEAKILSVEGVLDVTNTTINGSSSNLILDYKKIPLFGGVVINV